MSEHWDPLLDWYYKDYPQKSLMKAIGISIRIGTQPLKTLPCNHGDTLTAEISALESGSDTERKEKSCTCSICTRLRERDPKLDHESLLSHLDVLKSHVICVFTGLWWPENSSSKLPPWNEACGIIMRRGYHQGWIMLQGFPPCDTTRKQIDLLYAVVEDERARQRGRVAGQLQAYSNANLKAWCERGTDSTLWSSNANRIRDAAAESARWGATASIDNVQQDAGVAAEPTAPITKQSVNGNKKDNSEMATGATDDTMPASVAESESWVLIVLKFRKLQASIKKLRNMDLSGMPETRSMPQESQ